MASVRFREKGRFTKKQKIEWKGHILEVNRKRKTPVNDYVCENYEKLQGRRIVGMYMLGKEMWCASCDVPLSFRYPNNKIILGKVRCKMTQQRRFRRQCQGRFRYAYS